MAAQEVLGRALGISEGLVQAVLDPVALVEARKGRGGAARESVSTMLDELHEAITGAEAWANEAVGRLHAAEERLLAIARSLVTV